MQILAFAILQLMLAQDPFFLKTDTFHQALRASIKAIDLSADALKSLNRKGVIEQETQGCAADAATPELFGTDEDADDCAFLEVVDLCQLEDASELIVVIDSKVLHLTLWLVDALLELLLEGGSGEERCPASQHAKFDVVFPSVPGVKISCGERANGDVIERKHRSSPSRVESNERGGENGPSGHSVCYQAQGHPAGGKETGCREAQAVGDPFIVTPAKQYKHTMLKMQNSPEKGHSTTLGDGQRSGPKFS